MSGRIRVGPDALTPGEHSALTIASAVLRRGDCPGSNIAAILVLALERIAGPVPHFPGAPAPATTRPSIDKTGADCPQTREDGEGHREPVLDLDHLTEMVLDLDRAGWSYRLIAQAFQMTNDAARVMITHG